jgi:orotate phosphoribosyltransferase
MRRGFRLERDEPIVIVEDVVTTGKSTRETADAVRAAGGRVVGFASILNRSGRENPYEAVPYVYLLAKSLETYGERICPLCASDIPLYAPGSRHAK